MVGSKENYKFDVGVKGLIIYLLGIIVSCFHMFLHASRFETINSRSQLAIGIFFQMDLINITQCQFMFDRSSW